MLGVICLAKFGLSIAAHHGGALAAGHLGAHGAGAVSAHLAAHGIVHGSTATATGLAHAHGTAVAHGITAHATHVSTNAVHIVGDEVAKRAGRKMFTKAAKAAICAGSEPLVKAAITKMFTDAIQCSPTPLSEAEVEKAEAEETEKQIWECVDIAYVDSIATVLEMVGDEDAAKAVEISNKLMMLSVDLATVGAKKGLDAAAIIALAEGYTFFIFKIACE